MKNKEERIEKKEGEMQEAEEQKNLLAETEMGEERFFSGLVNWRLVALFVVGVLIGVVAKTQALEVVTIGAEDYKLKSIKSDYQLFTPRTVVNEDDSSEMVEEVEEIDSEEFVDPKGETGAE